MTRSRCATSADTVFASMSFSIERANGTMPSNSAVTANSFMGRVRAKTGIEGFDLAAARFGVEARHPWCDQRVLEFFLRVPMDVVVRSGWTKHVTRAAYAPELGQIAWHSGKQHLGPQVTRALLDAGRGWVELALADEAGVLREWIDPTVLTRAQIAWAQGALDPVANERAMELATLQRWLVGLAS